MSHKNRLSFKLAGYIIMSNSSSPFLFHFFPTLFFLIQIDTTRQRQQTKAPATQLTLDTSSEHCSYTNSTEIHVYAGKMSDYSTQKSQKIVDKSQKNPTKESGNPINSRSNSFLRSLKSSKPYKSSEPELEEGETISPSPSPRHTSIKVPDKSKDTARREPIKEKERSPSRHMSSSSRRREDSKRSNARQDYRGSRHDSDNESGSRRRSSSDRKRDKGYRSSRYHSRSRSTSRSRSPPHRKSRNRSSDTKSNRSESSRRRSSPPPPTATTTTTTSRSEKSITNGNSKNPDHDNNKRKRSPREKRDGSIDKSATTPSRTLTPTVSSSHVKETSDRNTKPKALSATAPDSETPEQCKLFIIM